MCAYVCDFAMRASEEKISVTVSQEVYYYRLSERSMLCITCVCDFLLKTFLVCELADSVRKVGGLEKIML